MRFPDWHIAVLVPARNEESLLPRCLSSIQAARSLLPANVSSDLIVCADNSLDRTASVARSMVEDTGVVILSSAGAVGSARAAAARCAISRCNLPLDRCWLANTDADCAVPPDWLVKQLSRARQAYMAIAGIVVVDSFVEHESTVERLFAASYLIHQDGTHPHVHGANLGVRADAYLQAGGWGRLATAEDHDLWNRLQKESAHVLSDADLRVVTSGRRVGRAPSGFAATLAAHNKVAA